MIGGDEHNFKSIEVIAPALSKQIYLSLDTPDTNCSLNQLRDCLHDIFNWMTDNKLKLNAYKTCRCCFYHIRDIRCIHRYMSFVVDKTIATALVSSRLDYCNSIYHNIALKDILKLQ